MAWSGSGTYSLPPAYSPEVNGTTIDAVRYNGLTSDVASGITACLAKNGENAPTANLPMGGFKHTGAADASATGQYIAFNQATAVGSLTITALTVTSATGERFIVTGSTVPANGIYLSAANTLAFASNTTARATVNSTGNWTINAPSSGTTLTVTGNTTALTVNGAAGGFPLNVNFGSGAGGFSQYQLSSVTKGYIGVDGGGLISSGTGDNFGIRADNELLLIGGGRDAMRVGTTGAVTIKAPSSGITLAATAPSAGTAFQGSDGTVFAQVNFSATRANFGATSSHDVSIFANNTAWLYVTTDGRIYGTALHNNAGAVTGTTNQYIASGTYTPTLTSVTNVTSTTARVSQWMRVGNVVSVSGSFSLTATSSSAVEVGISLPIASGLTGDFQCSGSASSDNSSQPVSGPILGDNANDRARYKCASGLSGVAIEIYFSFTYLVV